MGLTKNEKMKYRDRGYCHSDKYVCGECFGDEYLKKYVRFNGNKGKCSFCKLNGKPAKRNVLPLDDVLPIIMEVVNRDYLPALDNAMYDPEDKEYSEKVFDPFDFVTEELNKYLLCENSKLILEIENILLFEDRVSVYNWTSRQEDEDMREWEHYCTLVKESKLSAEQIVSECGRKRATENLIAIKNCLDKIYSYVVESRYMTSVVRPNTAIIRCGTHIKNTYMKDYDIAAIPASLVGTAPALATSNNRMSEKGDMMFYGAFTEK
jgi:hypothetical protein